MVNHHVSASVAIQTPAWIDILNFFLYNEQVFTFITNKPVSNFAKKVQEHLSTYKRNVLDIHVDGKYKGIPYGHILPDLREMWAQNFLPSIRESLSRYVRQKVQQKHIELHTYFHHLNSSQAMCLNFFYPLLETKKLEIILPLLSGRFNDEMIDYDSDNSVRFEKDGQENDWLCKNNANIIRDDPTSFDFYFRTKSGKKFFFEIKYTESGFGKEKSDDEHIEKFNKVYKKHLSHIKDEYHTANRFLDHYQIMRNLVHIDDESFVVFIYPSQNKGIVKGIKIASGALKNTLTISSRLNGKNWFNALMTVFQKKNILISLQSLKRNTYFEH
jgi:hypothetical protein